MSKDYRQQLIWETLQQNYPEEIAHIHELQYKDHQMYGAIQPETEKLLDELMEQVVYDNKKRREERGED